jgi:hypothetical protein
MSIVLSANKDSCPSTGVLDRSGRKILFWRSEDKYRKELSYGKAEGL